MQELKPGIYRHYKGKEYEVFTVACHSETDEKMVVYKALYACPDLKEDFGVHPYFVRPFSLFVDTVSIDKIEIPRFTYLKPAPKN